MKPCGFGIYMCGILGPPAGTRQLGGGVGRAAFLESPLCFETQLCGPRKLLNFSAPCFPRLENEVNETYCAGLLWGFLFYLFYFLFYCGDMHITFTILAIFKCTIPWHLVH